MKPNFIGIGVQKCATAWLYNILADHPQISLAMPEDGDKDTKFFSYFYDRGFEWYESHFKNCEGDVVGEYSTSYFYDINAPERIYDYSPDMKLIVSLRHPVERTFSNHKHEITLGRISGDNMIFENGLKNNPMYLHQSLYYTHLSRWLKYFTKEQIFIIIVDDLKKNPEEVAQNIYKFLGVNYEYKPFMLTQRLHETRIPKNIFFESLIKKISSFFRWVGGGNLIDFLKSKGVIRIIRKINSKSEEDVFSPMEDKTRTYLLNYFIEENEKLSVLINRDLSNWNR